MTLEAIKRRINELEIALHELQEDEGNGRELYEEDYIFIDSAQDELLGLRIRLVEIEP